MPPNAVAVMEAANGPALDWSGHSEEEQAALLALLESLAALGVAFEQVRAAGLAPAAALRACGLEIPAFAAPILNQMLP